MREKCSNAKSEPRKFWQTFSPYLSNKEKDSTSIQLMEGEKFINDPKDISELFNSKFTTIADDIGLDSQYSKDISEHPSYNIIRNHVMLKNIDEFDFKLTNVANVQKILNDLNVNKATGYDRIPARILKASSDIIAPVVCNAVNKTIEKSTFPDQLKKAEVVPIFKSKSRLTGQITDL
jgi:hypothetical protein